MQFPPRKKKVASCNFVAADFVLALSSSSLRPRRRCVVLAHIVSNAHRQHFVSFRWWVDGWLGGWVAPGGLRWGRWVSGTASEFAAVGGARHARWPSCVGCNSNRNRKGKGNRLLSLAPPPSSHYFYMLAQSLWHSPPGVLAGFGGEMVVVVALVVAVVQGERLSLCITFSMHRGAFCDATMLPGHCCNLLVVVRFVGFSFGRLHGEKSGGSTKIYIY